jgi:hypothetical protein
MQARNRPTGARPRPLRPALPIAVAAVAGVLLVSLKHAAAVFELFGTLLDITSLNEAPCNQARLRGVPAT